MRESQSVFATAGLPLLAVGLACLSGLAFGWGSWVLLSRDTELGPADANTSGWWLALAWALIGGIAFGVTSLSVTRRYEGALSRFGWPLVGCVAGFLAFWFLLILLWEPAN